MEQPCDLCQITLHTCCRRVGKEGNRIVRVRPSVRSLPLQLLNQLTFELDFLHVHGSWRWYTRTRRELKMKVTRQGQELRLGSASMEVRHSVFGPTLFLDR